MFNRVIIVLPISLLSFCLLFLCLSFLCLFFLHRVLSRFALSQTWAWRFHGSSGLSNGHDLIYLRVLDDFCVAWVG
jgi:hypothetical protein